MFTHQGLAKTPGESVGDRRAACGHVGPSGRTVLPPSQAPREPSLPDLLADLVVVLAGIGLNLLLSFVGMAGIILRLGAIPNDTKKMLETKIAKLASWIPRVPSERLWVQVETKRLGAWVFRGFSWKLRK